MSNLQIVTEVGTSSSQDKTGNNAVVALCEAGGEDLFAVGGGYILGGEVENVTVTVNRPDGLAGEVPAGWRVEAVETGGGQSGSWTLTAYVVCGNVH